MCYLIVKDLNKKESIVLKVNSGEEVAEISSVLSARLRNTSKAVMTISDIEAWGEYAPFTVIGSVEGFISMAEEM